MSAYSRLVVVVCLAFAANDSRSENPLYWSFHLHTHHENPLAKKYLKSVIDKGRVQVVALREGLSIDDLPDWLRPWLKPIDLERELPLRTDLSQIAKKRLNPDPNIEELIERLTPSAYRDVVTWITEFGQRTTDDSIEAMMGKLTESGYDPVHDYNIEATKTGVVEPEKWVIIQGHMDTVANTVGADDNASGAAGVLEAARILADVDTRYSVLFLITEDEERGLLGSKRKVAQLRASGQLQSIQYVVNMDMIGYNSNGIVDLETEDEFEDVALWLAEQTLNYTSLEPNIVLTAWGSDHVPFIEAGVVSLMTIEHWNTHNPCWHKACDRLDKINWDYATEIVRLNIAAVALKAGAIF